MKQNHYLYKIVSSDNCQKKEEKERKKEMELKN